MQSFSEYRMNEATTNDRYSVEVNYRTSISEVTDKAVQIILGYVSAAFKNLGLHTKQVYEQKPLRLLISTRNWDDGEWIGVVSWHPARNCFILSKGFFNKDRKTVSVQSSHPSKSQDASEIVKELRTLMHEFKGLPDRHQDKMKPVPLKTGPKK